MALEAPVLGRQLTILSAWFCPFAQRTLVALSAKHMQYSLHEVAIKNPKTGLWHQLDEKPEWFLQLNPLGKVPTLAYKQGETTHSVYESNICNEFLEDYQPEPALFSKHPVLKTRQRTQDKQQQKEVASEIQDQLQWLEKHADADGPYFMGSEFGMVDIALVPWFIRMFILEHYRGFGLPSSCSKLASWQKHTIAHEAVQSTMLGAKGVDAEYHDQLLEHYSRYADASANSTSAHDFK